MSNKGKAVLVGVQLPDVSDSEHEASMAELGRLVKTLGFDVVGEVSQKRTSTGSATILGEGKLEILQDWTRSDEDDETPAQASIVIFDCDIGPSQLSNLESATGAEVLDRTGVIVEIFSRHAKTREAKLQVEIAKLTYMAPRLRASRVGLDRQGGGIGSKGSGESAHELDKRRIRDRISELKRQLEAIAAENTTRRSRRAEWQKVALVGYTNAGKSSMMRALTGSEILVADKLFATLDTTIRTLVPPTVPQILVSDTVGFIKKLPHDLVASFRSTLEEAHEASLLLFVVDATDPTFRSQLEVTNSVLAEIGVDDIPSILVLNKSDQLSPEQTRALQSEFPEAVIVSAHNPDDIKKMHQLLADFFERDMTTEHLHIPYLKGSVLGKIRSMVRVISEDYDEKGVNVNIKTSEPVLRQIQKLLNS